MALYAFDGTWNDAGTDHKNKRTNVYRFKCLYSAADRQRSFYWPEVGSRFGPIGKALGLLGLGARWRVSQALTRVYEQFRSGDEIIDVVGFSRGAATAASFAWVLYEWGVRAPRKAGPFTFGLMRFRRGELLHPRPQIRFVGLFDTVFTTEGLEYHHADLAGVQIARRR